MVFTEGSADRPVEMRPFWENRAQMFILVIHLWAKPDIRMNQWEPADDKNMLELVTASSGVSSVNLLHFPLNVGMIKKSFV